MRVLGKRNLKMPVERKCIHCGTTENLRPYGPNLTYVCFTCGMLDEHKEETKKNFLSQLDRIQGNVILTDEGPIPANKRELS